MSNFAHAAETVRLAGFSVTNVEKAHRASNNSKRDTHRQERRSGFQSAAILALSLTLAACGGGGGGKSSEPVGGGGNSPTPVTISGIAATGDPLSSAVVTLKAQNGTTKTATAGSDGAFSIDVTGLAAPFLLQAVSADGKTTLFSAASASGTTNIHPFTDLAVKSYYEVLGKTASSTFSSVGSGTLLPASVDLRNLSTAINEVLATMLVKEGVANAAAFNIFNTAFAANQVGFDSLLHDTQFNGLDFIVTSGTLAQHVTVTGSGGNVTFSNTTTDATAGTSTTCNTDVPVAATTSQQQSDEQAAVNEVQTLWTNIVSVVAAKGTALSGTDLIPYLDPGFLDRGATASVYADRLALLLSGLVQGQTLSQVNVGQIYSFSEPVNGSPLITAAVDLTVKNTASGNTFTFPVIKYHQAGFADDGRAGLTYIKQSDGGYKLFGDHSIAYTELLANSTTYYTANGGSSSAVMGLSAFAPFATLPSLTLPAGIGTVASIVVTNDDAQLPVCSGALLYPFNHTSLGQSSVPLTEAEVGGFALTLNGLELFLGCNNQLLNIMAPPPAGTRYTVTYTTPTAATSTVTAQIRTQTSEVPSLASINGVSPSTFLASHHAADIIGQQLALVWSLPTTFAVESTNINCNTFDIVGNQFLLAPVHLAPTATSGTTPSFPATLASTGTPTVNVYCEVNLIGRGGEILTASFNVL